MRNFIIAFLLSCFFFFPSMAQKSIISSTIASGGASVIIEGKYYSHVIGQPSVMGTYTNGGVVVRQGFKQPNLLLNSIQKSGISVQMKEENPIHFEVYPNPFVDRISIRFSEISPLPSYLLIYDLMGKTVWESAYPAQIMEIVLQDFQGFKTGKYILHLVQKGKPFVSSLIKEN